MSFMQAPFMEGADNNQDLFLGYFADEAALNNAYPTAPAGSFAIVEDTDTIWVWDDDTSSWTDSGNPGNISYLGFFNTEADLTTAYPTSSDGKYAIVGATRTVWVWSDSASAWIDSVNDNLSAPINPQFYDITVTNYAELKSASESGLYATILMDDGDYKWTNDVDTDINVHDSVRLIKGKSYKVVFDVDMDNLTNLVTAIKLSTNCKLETFTLKNWAFIVSGAYDRGIIEGQFTGGNLAVAINYSIIEDMMTGDHSTNAPDPGQSGLQNFLVASASVQHSYIDALNMIGSVYGAKRIMDTRIARPNSSGINTCWDVLSCVVANNEAAGDPRRGEAFSNCRNIVACESSYTYHGFSTCNGVAGCSTYNCNIAYQDCKDMSACIDTGSLKGFSHCYNISEDSCLSTSTQPFVNGCTFNRAHRKQANNAIKSTFDFESLTADRTHEFPDKSGKMAIQGDNVLELDNTTPFTPTADYHPATKKYVDGSAHDGDMRISMYDPAGIEEQVVGETATQTLSNKTLTEPEITNPTGMDKDDVGLDQVDNTSDADKPVSDDTQDALNDKSDVGHTHTGADVSDLDNRIDNNLSVTANTAKRTYPAGDQTKVDHITVTHDVNLDDMNADLADKQDKVTGAGVDNVASFDTGGQTKDSGVAVSTIATKVASGVEDNFAALDSEGNLKDSGNKASDFVNVAEKGAADGVAELDSGGKVPASQLPAYVDDVTEYDDLASFPATGESGKIYVAKDTNKTYRWSGSAYVEISASLALGETSATAYRGDRGKTAFDHTSLTDNPHSVTKDQVGLGNADDTSDADKPVSTAQQNALDNKVEKNVNITPGTHTKVTYDTKGLVTSAEDATTADIPESTDKNYITDAEKTVISNTSGANTGDQDLSGLALKSNVLEKDNTTAYTPTLDYHPATKKFVDDAIAKNIVIVTVGASNSDYTTIKAALAAITDASSSKRYVIQVAPGEYSEDNPIQCKEYVDIVGLGKATNVKVSAQNSGSNGFDLVAHSSIRRVDASGATTGSGFNADTAITVDLESCHATECKYGITSSHADAKVYVNGFGITNNTATMEACYYCTAGEIIVGSPRIIADSKCNKVAYTNGTSAIIDIQGGVFSSDQIVSAYFADNGGKIYIGGSFINEATNALHIGSTGSNSEIRARNCMSVDCDYDIKIESSTGMIHAFESDINRDKISIVNGAHFHGSGLDKGYDAYRYIIDVNIGKDDNGHILAVGEGGPYQTGMKILTYDGSSYTDVTDSATISFPNTSANTCIYVGNTTPIKFYGRSVTMGDTQLDLGSGSIIKEYYDSGAGGWVDFASMSTKRDSSDIYTSNPFTVADEGDVVTTRFDEDINTGITENDSSATGWSTTSVNSISGYWVRLRIVSAITTSMKVKDFYLKGNYSITRANGTQAFHGSARPKKFMNLPVGDSVGTTANSTFNVSPNISYSGRENKFADGVTDVMYLKYVIPSTLDLSCGLRIIIDWKCYDNTSVTAKMHLRYSILKMSQLDSETILYNGNNSETHVEFDLKTASGDAANKAHRHEIIKIDLSAGGYQPGDVIYMALKRNSDESGDDLDNVIITGYWDEYREWQTGEL